VIYDYIIIGSGISGLNAARLIPKNKKTLVLCKKSPWDCNTFWAQGGIARAVNKNDIPTHINDTLIAGVNHNNKEAVRLLSEKSINAIDNLIKAGLQFDLSNKGKLTYTKEAAHSRNRILHADGDATGRMIHIFLLGQCKHEIVTQAMVNDLLIQDDICYAVQYFTSRAGQKIAYTHNTIIASGGVGSIYRYHTNSTTIAGEMQGLIVDKGFRLKDMEMMQFHPTVVKGTSFARKPLLSEALRGEGAHIVDENGKRFLFSYHKDAELAPRDIVSRSIFDYNNKTGKSIFLSFEKFEKKWFKKRFPNIYANLKDLGYNLPFEKVPISPAFHYAMGGIETTLNAKVKGMKNLYAIGECSCVGVHGANRLASNSLLEGIVFSQIAAEESLKNNFEISKEKYKKEIKVHIKNKKIDKDIKNNLREIMWANVAIVREEKKLIQSLNIIESYLLKDVGRMLYLRLLTAKSILQASIKRKNSLGAHFIKK